VRQNAVKYVFSQGSASKLAVGAHSTPPNFLAAVRGLTCKGKRNDRKKDEDKRREQEEKERKGREEGRKRGP